MKRLATAFAGVVAAGALVASPVAHGAADNADASFPLPDGTTLETHTTANCVSADKQCYFTASADRNVGGGIQGFPDGLWARQTTTIRSSNRMVNQETQVVADNTRVFKEGWKREITTIYFGGGPPEKYRITGTTQPIDWQTGLARLDSDYIVCTFIQVVYPGVNITSPQTCSQTTFS